MLRGPVIIRSPRCIFLPDFPSSCRAHRSLRPRQQSRRRADGGRHRPAVSPVVQAAGRGLRGVGDGRVESAPVGHGEIAAAHRSSRRGGADRRADRGRRPARDGRCRALQRRARRADHRHQHGLPGEEGLQRCRRIRAARQRTAGRVDHRRGGARGRRARHAQDPHRHRPAAPERARDSAHRRERRHQRARRARSHACLRLCRTGRIRHDPRRQGRGRAFR